MTESGGVVTNMVDVQGLAVRYRSATVFSNLSLRINRGSSVAVMGPSGSGKSSLLACLTGIQVPSAGTVSVAGHRVSAMSASDRAAFRRRHMGLVFQDPDLLPELSVEENVALTLLFDGTSRVDALRLARAALSSVGLSQHGSKRTDEISGGQAQRAALALVRPDMSVLVADEPTASLDAANARLMIDSLLARTRELGAVAVVATHDIAVAQRCDAVFDIARSAQSAA